MRAAAIGFLLGCSLWPACALALEPGGYIVRCGPAEAGGQETQIRMDIIDLLTLRQSFGAIISGVSMSDGRKLVLVAGDRSCSLIEARGRPAAK